jgi:hypothetical protein
MREAFQTGCGDGQHVQIWGETSESYGGGGGEILVAAGEDIPALATSTSALGAHAPFLSVDSRGCLLP